MAYRVVESYYRQLHFDYFRGYQTPFYSLTFELDITALRAFAERHHYPVYLSLCYFFTGGAQPIEDLRYRVLDGRIVLYERLDFAATLPAPDGLFSFARYEYDPDFATFHRRAEEITRRARERVTLAESADTNHLLFTALPRVPFTGFAHAKSGDATDARPRVAFGQFRRDGDRLRVPVGLEVNHIFVDGAAVGELVDSVQAELESLDT